MKILIIDRLVNPRQFIEPGLAQGLRWIDSCGSRSVFYWDPIGDGYDKTGKDLPSDIFNKIKEGFDSLVKKYPETIQGLCMHREDPGLGIYIPEIDSSIK